MPETTSSPTISRRPFTDIFQKNPDGSLTPRYVIEVNGVTFGPGVSFAKGVSFSGIDFFGLEKYDLAIDEENGVMKIVGYYES